jgi:hypothetical protein
MDSILGCDAVQPGRSPPTIRRNILSPFSKKRASRVRNNHTASRMKTGCCLVTSQKTVTYSCQLNLFLVQETEIGTTSIHTSANLVRIIGTGVRAQRDKSAVSDALHVSL